LRYVVITSVNRDDLRDGGAGHFAACIEAVRAASPATRIEILTPDFRGRVPAALALLRQQPPDVFNHNLETVPRLYRAVRPGADYQVSLELLRDVKALLPAVPTKSGLMLGVGETFDEIVEVLKDLRAHGCEMLTLGQYLQPSQAHLPVLRYVPPEEFDRLGAIASELGFTSVASAPMVRSSYHADQQAAQLLEARMDAAPALAR
jgi:lipoic acid synthetase